MIILGRMEFFEGRYLGSHAPAVLGGQFAGEGEGLLVLFLAGVQNERGVLPGSRRFIRIVLREEYFEQPFIGNLCGIVFQADGFRMASKQAVNRIG